MTKLTDTLSLSEQRDGWWLWDETRRMNLSMRAKTEQEAFVQALGYYQRRLSEVEKKYYSLQAKVDSFVTQFVNEEDYE